MSAKTLASVKERLSGREDLPCMIDDENDDDVVTEDILEGVDMEIGSSPEIGQLVTGCVIDVDEIGALLAIGGKKSGIIPVAEAGLMPVKHMSELFKVGDTITAEMIGTLRGMPVLSIRSAQLVEAWKNVSHTRAAEEAFPVRILEVNKGGAVCSAFGGLKAFLPGSHYLGSVDDSLIGSIITVREPGSSLY